MNTIINYQYRDASNWKQHNEAIVQGTLTEEQIDTIINCLEDGEYFIPRQIGLPEIRFAEICEDDHCWFELDRAGFEITERCPTVQLTAKEVVGRFLEARNNWEVFDPMEIL